MITPLAILLLAGCSGDAIPTGPGLADAIRGEADAAPSISARSHSLESDGTTVGAPAGDPRALEPRLGQLAGIRLPGQLTASEGEKLQLEATLEFEGGDTRPRAKVRWTSADPAIASIDLDGLVTARLAGSTVLLASAGGLQQSVKLTVSNASVDAIALNATEVELLPGESFQFWADLYTADGDRFSKKINWRTSDAAVVIVDTDGLALALGPGVAEVEAKSGGVTATATVHVAETGGDGGSAPPSPDRVTDLGVTSVTESSVSLRFTEVDDGTGSAADYLVRFAETSLDWSTASDVTKGSCASLSGSSVGSVLTCSVDGLQPSTVYGFQVAAYREASGSDPVFGPVSNTASATTDDPPMFVDVTPSSAKMKKGEEKQFDAQVTDAYGNPVSGYDIAWNSTDDAVATVDQTGDVTAQQTGNASIQASIDGASDMASVTVEADTTSGGGTSSGGTSGGGNSGGSGGGTSGGSGTTGSSAQLSVSVNADRSGGTALEGETLVGDVFVFLEVSDSAVVDSVIFTLDGEPVKKESLRPYDLKGGSDAAANPWDTNDVADGPHSLQAVAYGEPMAEAVADFSVDNSAGGNQPPPPPSDQDGDGVPDADDQCPADPGPSSNNGCPVSPPTSSAYVPAFPGCEGYGCEALEACRALPLRVWKVTNLNDSGEGSYRDAIQNKTSSDHFDVIVFETGGTIVLNSRVRKDRTACVYVAGQTAPGGGIQFTSPGWSTPTVPLALSEDTDWVVRYLRFRQNASDGTGAQFQNIGIGSSQRIVLDHISTCCSDDKEIAVDQSPELGRPVFDLITISNSIVYAPTQSSTGINIHGDPGADIAGSVSVIRNYMGGNKWRFPRFESLSNGQVVNNIIYGWISDGVRVGTDAAPGPRLNLEWVNNYEKKYDPGKIEQFGAVEYSNDVSYHKQGLPNFYVAGNVHTVIAPSPSDDQTQWRWREDRTGLVPDSAFKSSPTLNPRPVFDVVPRWGALELMNRLLPDVGASRRLACDGTWVNARDALDATFVAEAQNSTWTGGDGAAAYGGLPNLSAGTACDDADDDGLPDEYELRWGLDPNNWDSGADTDGDGYLNIEEYLSGSEPNS